MLVYYLININVRLINVHIINVSIINQYISKVFISLSLLKSLILIIKINTK